MIDNILNSLQKVRKTGRGQWIACCPAHQDKSPSLSIRELDDGKILLHCFAECGIGEILSALSLSIEDLFPERLGDSNPYRSPFNAKDVLAAILHEATIVSICASELTKHPLSNEDRNRLFKAVARINKACELAGVTNG